MQLVARFYDPAAGRVEVAGHDLRGPAWAGRLDALRNGIGYVAQEPVPKLRSGCNGLHGPCSGVSKLFYI